jgi:hypothetical protein
MKFSPLMVAALLGLAAVSAPAFADDTDMNKPAPRCFSMRDFENWKAPDASTMYIRVGLNRYYRLDLSGKCPALTWPSSHLITKTRGSDQVCSGLDWDLAVSDSTGGIGRGGGFRQACIVKTQTPLSAADVAAIPKKFKP